MNVFELKYIPRFNHFELGYYRGLRWFLILRELLAILYFIIFLIFKKKKKNIERIHLNELELIICAPFLKFFYNCIITSHLRCPLEIKKGRFRYSFLKYLTKNILKNFCNRF